MNNDRDPAGSERTDTPAGSKAGAPADGTADTDPWESFGPASVRTPGRARRWTGRVGRVLRHEWTVVSVLGVLLAVAMTWPAALHPSTTLPEDLGDPTLVSWVLSWSGHAIIHNPAQLWHSNTFYPNPYSFAFTDTMLGYLPANVIGTGFVAAIVRYNVLFIFAFALAFVGTYALVRQLGANRIGAALAGVAYTYAPWHYAQAGHLHIMSNGGIVLSLAMLARGHGLSLRDGYRRELVRPGWILAGWLVAAWQISIGFGVGIVFGYVLGCCVLVAAAAWLLRRWRPPRRVVLFDVAGGLVFVAVTAFMAYPFFRVQQTYGKVERTIADLKAYSPPLRGFFTAPPDSLLWGTAHTAIRESLPFPAEMALLPGFALLGLALVGLFVSAWSVRVRLVLAVGVVLTFVCALGTNGPFDGRLGYVALYHLPGLNALRTPGRLILWATLLLGVLAAGALTGLAGRGTAARGNRVPGWRERLLRVASLIPLALVVAEGVNTMPHPVVPAPPAGFAQLRGPMLILPYTGMDDELYMLWSTSGFPTMVNGISGYQPPKQTELRAAGDKFPDAAAVEQLRAAGVRTVVILRNQMEDPMQLAGNAESLGITREERGDMIVYTLTP